jgi:hypothetical protein
MCLRLTTSSQLHASDAPCFSGERCTANELVAAGQLGACCLACISCAAMLMSLTCMLTLWMCMWKVNSTEDDVHVRHCREGGGGYQPREYRGPSDYDNVETFGTGAAG